MASSCSFVAELFHLQKRENFLGSAVLVSPRHAVTCAHVVRRNARTIYLWFGDRQVEARVVGKDAEADLALLEFTSLEGIEPAVWTDEVHVTDRLDLVGFDGVKSKTMSGTVEGPECDRNTADLDSIQVNVVVHEGMSGGAAVHVHAGRHRCVGLIKEGGKGTNYSIIIGEGAVARFLDKHRVTLVPWKQPRTPPRQFDTAQYKARVAEEHATIKPPGLPPGHTVEIDRIYIHLSGAFGTDEREHRSRPLEQAVAEHRRLLISGPAGSGKTMFLRRIAMALCRDKDEKMPLPFRGLPMFVRVSRLEEFIAGRLAQKKPGDPVMFDHPRWIGHYLAEQHEVDAQVFLDALQNESDAVLLLDGLDEASTAGRRAVMAALFRQAARRWACRIVVTSRPEALQDDAIPDGFAQTRVDRLDVEAAKGFLFEWYRCVKKGDDLSAARRRDRLVDAVQTNAAVRDLARNPLMLTALAVVEYEENELPEQRAELYEWITGWLAKQREDRPLEPGEVRMRPDDRLALLGLLAYVMQSYEGGHRMELGVGDAAEKLGGEFPNGRLAERFLEREQLDSGIVTLRRGEIRFWHRAFQEFLAARHLAGLSMENETIPVAVKRLYDLEWKEVIALLAGCMRKRQKRQLDLLMTALVGSAKGRPLPKLAHAVGVLGATLQDLQPTNYPLPTQSDSLYRELLGSVLDIFEPGAHQRVGIQDRMAAADALALARDPRLFQPNRREYWVPVPAGEFLMGSDSSDTEADDDEKLRLVKFEKAFLIGRFPVTVWEYREFLVETLAAPPHEWEEQLKHPSRPVVWITFEEAEAYCKRFECRLPTEEEWEYAARGSGSRRYPWGSERPDASRANFNKSIGHATPVGLYAEGNTPEGLCDMAGNVWEWTRTPWPSGGHVVRGGSWWHEATQLRSAYRDGDGPDWDDSDGFRCVREVFP